MWHNMQNGGGDHFFLFLFLFFFCSDQTELEYKSRHKTIPQSAMIASHMKWTGFEFV